MPVESLKPALRAALRMHEIGTKSPYRLFFAGKGNSGASFGFMQGDLAAKQGVATTTFKAALAAADIDAAQIAAYLKVLSVHMISNPLSKFDTDRINAALASQSILVDQMDENILNDIYKNLDVCIATAAKANRTIDPKAAIMMALWINMSGPPTKLLTWLSGGEPHLTRPIPTPGSAVTGVLMESYLRATDYYVSNPQNISHLLESVDVGIKVLNGSPATLADIPAPPYMLPGEKDHLVYEQKTGRMLTCENGKYDTLAIGYSGSLSKHGVNDPDQQCVKSAGPIPRGTYLIGDPELGPSPYSLRLTPDPANHMCGRDGFLIHGDSIQHPGDASDGCIILKRSEREAIVASGLKTLIVVAQIST